MGYVTQRDRLPEARGRAGLEELYHDRIQAADEFQYLLSNSAYTGEFYTIKDWSYRSAEMAGPGYFAVGGAACSVDPILSSGVYLAVLYAKMCAVAVNTCLVDPSREQLVGEWYEGLYADTDTDYLQRYLHGLLTDGATVSRRPQGSEVDASGSRSADQRGGGRVHGDRPILVRWLGNWQCHTHPR